MLAVDTVSVGTKLLIAGGLTAEVIENMGDGERVAGPGIAGQQRSIGGDVGDVGHATDVQAVT